MSDTKIKVVNKIKDGVYLINNQVQISDIKFDENYKDGIYCKTDFNDNEITEDDANYLVDEFFGQALKQLMENDNEL